MKRRSSFADALCGIIIELYCSIWHKREEWDPMAFIYWEFRFDVNWCRSIVVLRAKAHKKKKTVDYFFSFEIVAAQCDVNLVTWVLSGVFRVRLCCDSSCSWFTTLLIDDYHWFCIRKLYDLCDFGRWFMGAHHRKNYIELR